MASIMMYMRVTGSKNEGMSQLAIFYLLDASKLEQLHEHAWVEEVKKLFNTKYIDHYDEYLKNNGVLLYGMSPDHWNAPPFLCMTAWMTEEKNIDWFGGQYKKEAEALTEKSGMATFIWTAYHREALRQIDVDNLPDEEMKRIGMEYYGVDTDEDVVAMRDSTKQMKKILERVEEGKVIIFLIA